MRQANPGRALFWNSALSEPVFTMYGFIGLILYKDLGASAWQIALLTTLKPVISIFSFYWSAGLGERRKVKSNVLWAGFLMRAPFLFCPWFDSAWYVIAAAVNYMFFHRAAIPGWMELVKRNSEAGKLGRLFSFSSAFGYAEGIILSLGMGAILDRDPGLWKILFFAAALVGMGVLLIQARIPFRETQAKIGEGAQPGWSELILRPWKDSFQLIRSRRDFAEYQWGFMLCGFGIMLIQPVLPIFAVDDLGVSHTMAAGGISIAKGLGVALSSFFWARWIERVHIIRLASWVFLSVSLFPALLACSVWWIGWFYIAYFWYGIGQGGSHLAWHLSGPFFAGKEESSRYSSVGLMMVGMRGAVAPPLGGWLSGLVGPAAVLVLGGLLSFYSGIRLLKSPFVKDIPLTPSRDSSFVPGRLLSSQEK